MCAVLIHNNTFRVVGLIPHSWGFPCGVCPLVCASYVCVDILWVLQLLQRPTTAQKLGTPSVSVSFNVAM